MSVLNKLLEEPGIYVWLFLLMSFLGLTYNVTFATVYTILIIVSFLIYLVYKPRLNLNAVKGNTLKNLAMGFGVFIGFKLLMVLIYNSINLLKGATSFSAMDAVVFGNLLSSNNPILANNRWVALFVFAILIPIIETHALGRFFEFLTQTFNVNQRINDIKTWAVMFVVSGSFVWFHIQAKGLGLSTASLASLVLVFIFGIVTCLMFVLSKEMEGAVYLHIFNNSDFMLRLLGLMPKGL